MPEGDTIHRSAHRLRPIMSHAHIVSAMGSDRFIDASNLSGQSIESIEARGKHLLMHLSDGHVIHSHMGMTGSWHVYQEGERWRKDKRRAALIMDVQANETNQKHTVVCFSPKTLELLTKTQLRRHRYLQRLGPDLMTGKVDTHVVLSRFRVHNVTPIGEAVMNQTIVSGIGNVYKSEVLFIEGANPFLKVSDFSDDQIQQIIQQAQALMQKNIVGSPRQTRRKSDGERLWVYGRSGKPCFRCETMIELRRQGDLGRSTYWCPRCQS